MAEEARKYLRSKSDGHLFPYSEHLVGHPDLEEVDDEKAYPERNVPEHVEKAKAKAGPEPEVSSGITPESGTEKPAPTDPALAKQAGKGLPK